jgi:hypothetical protein
LTVLDPLTTITSGIEAAQNNGRSRICVAGGTYPEQLTMLPGIKLLGGYNSAFDGRDLVLNETTIENTTGGSAVIATDAAIGSGDCIDGFTIQFNTSGTISAYGRAIHLANGASLNVTNNKIHMVDSSTNQDNLIGILVSSGTYCEYDCSICCNTVVLYKTNATIHGTRTFYITRVADNSRVLIAGNRISAYGNKRTDGIWLYLARGEIVIKNNIVSVRSDDGMALSITVDYSAAKIVNNTITSHYRAVFHHCNPGSATLVTELANNILCGRASGISAVSKSQAEGVLNYHDNLVFDFSSEASGFASGVNNDFYAADIFTTVFSSAFDTDFTDGDDSDYHLISTGAGYAIDEGVDAFEYQYGCVLRDFERNIRPAGSTYDRGAYEYQP